MVFVGFVLGVPSSAVPRGPFCVRKPKHMALRITQATFHAAVVENMTEFEMNKTEALADAIEQFKQQGVDLSNLDLSGGAITEDGTVEVRAIRCISFIFHFFIIFV